MASSNDISSTNHTENEDWVLVPADSKAHTEDWPSTKKKPFFEFNVDVQLSTVRRTYVTVQHARHPLSNQPLSTNIPQTQLEKLSLVAEQEHSFLFALPLEIRLQIYDYVLRPPPSNDFGVRMTRSPIHPNLPTVLSILSTCRQALYEAEHIFYASNRLVIDGAWSWARLGPIRQNAVQALAVPVHSAAGALEALNNLQEVPGLQSLYLVRRMSARYTEISAWKLLTPQLVAQIEKLPKLEELKIITPEAAGIVSGDEERKERLDSIDSRLRQALRIHRKTG